MEGGFGSGGWGVTGWGGSFFERSFSAQSSSSDEEPKGRLNAAASIQDQSAIDDSNVVSGSLWNAYIDESGSLIFEPSSKVFFVSAVQEIFSAVDESGSNVNFKSLVFNSALTFDAVSSSQNFKANIEDSADGSVSFNAAQNFNAQAQEFASGLADVGSRFSFLSDVIESVNASDQGDANIFIGGIVSESAFSDGVYAAQQNFDVKVVEGIGLTEEPFASQTFVSEVFEVGFALDLFQSRYLWNPVDDFQPEDWRPVDDIQSENWRPVDDSQPQNWRKVITTN